MTQKFQYIHLTAEEVKTAFNDNRVCDKLYRKLAATITTDEIVAEENATVRHLLYLAQQALGETFDSTITSKLYDVYLEADEETRKARGAKKELYRAVTVRVLQLWEEAQAVYEQNHAWDD